MADFLICGSLDGVLIPGSLVERCARCAAAVAIAPSGRRLRARHGLQILCLQCGTADQQSGAPIEPLNAEQLAELAAYRDR